MTGDRDRGILRAEATIQYQAELDNQINRLYPRVASLKDPILKDLQRRNINHVSFALDDPKLVQAILTIIFERASDKKDALSSEHGAEHQVYEEALVKLATAAKAGRTNYDIQQIRKLDRDIGPVSRLVVTTPPYKRDVHLPAPVRFWEELQDKYSDEAARKRTIRQAALDYGIPFALLVSIFANYNFREIAAVFDEGGPMYRTELQNRWGKNSINQLPHQTNRFSNEENLGRTIGRLSKLLVEVAREGTFPTKSAEKYQEAIKILRALFPEQSGRPNQFAEVVKFIEIPQTARGLAVLQSLSEVAHGLTNPAFAEPKKTEYIRGKFGGSVTQGPTMTTRLLTAYLQFAPPAESTPIYIYPKGKKK
jgi:hypothetical protein